MPQPNIVTIQCPQTPTASKNLLNYFDTYLTIIKSFTTAPNKGVATRMLESLLSQINNENR